MDILLGMLNKRLSSYNISPYFLRTNFLIRNITKNGKYLNNYEKYFKIDTRD